MDVRGKLVELILNADNDKNLAWYDLYDLCQGKGCAEYFADYLIANGVTVQEWISVKDRLPEKQKDVLMNFDSGNMAVGFWHDGDEIVTFWCAYTDDGFYTDCDCEPTHWMPLPEPPKEEA